MLLEVSKVEDIGDWLNQYQLGHYSELFRSHEITVDLLPQLLEEDLDELALEPKDRNLLENAIQALINSTSSDFSQDSVSEFELSAGSGSIARAERRHMTVMFIDVAQSDRLSNRLDPETYASTLKQFQQLVIEVVQQWDGFVARFFGNGVLAYFGWPAADASDAERAVHAALEINARLSLLENTAIVSAGAPQLTCRIGIATGLVLVEDIVGDRQTYQDAIYGVTPNLAARLQSSAKPGEIIVADATEELVHRWFRLTSLGKTTLKGIDEKVGRWKVESSVKELMRFEAHTGQIALTPFVNRNVELKRLLQHWEKTVAGDGRALFVSGEAGIGKSRLVHEFFARVRITKDASNHLQCSPFHRNVSAYPIVQHFENVIPADETDKVAVLVNAMKNSGVNDPQAPMLIGWFMGIVDIWDLPVDNKDVTSLATRCLKLFVEYFVGMSAESPAILIIEDAQWIDPTTARVIEQIADRAATTPSLMLVTSRDSSLPVWCEESDRHVELKPLDETNSALLTCSVAGVTDLDKNLVKTLSNATNGNPLYVEEVTRVLLNDGQLRVNENRLVSKAVLNSLSIPARLRDSITGRIDALEELKPLTFLAAAIGRAFSFTFICAVSQETSDKLRQQLYTLIKGGIIRSDNSGGPVAQFRFTHSLLQDVAYDMILQDEKRRLHARIAAELGQLQHDQVTGAAQIQAHHHERAGQNQEAATCLLKASQVALKLSASEEALKLLQHGLSLVADLPPSDTTDQLHMQMYAMQGTAFMLAKGWGSEDVNAAYANALKYQHAAKGPEEKQWINWGAWVYQLVSGQLQSSVKLADDMLRSVQNSNDAERLLIAHMVQMHAQFYTGNFSHALQHGESMVKYYDASKHAELCHKFSVDLLVVWHVHAAQLYYLLGDAPQAEVHYLKVQNLAENTSHLHTRLWANTWGANYLLLSEQSDVILEKFPAILELAKHHGFLYTSSLAEIILSDAQLQHSLDEKSLQKSELALQAFQATGTGITVPYFLARQARALIQTGRHQEAMNKVNEAHKQATCWGEQWAGALIQIIRSEILIMQAKPDIPAARSALQAAEALARQQHCGLWLKQSSAALKRLG